MHHNAGRTTPGPSLQKGGEPCPAARLASETAANAGVQVYPKPVTDGVLRLRIHATESETAQLVLSNGRGGRQVSQRLPLKAGDNAISVPLGGLLAGLSLVSVQRGTGRVVQKIVVR